MVGGRDEAVISLNELATPLFVEPGATEGVAYDSRRWDETLYRRLSKTLKSES